MDRKSALQVTEYKAFGGTFFDSISHAAMFRDEKAYDFGVMTAGLFSSTKMMGLTNKRWSYLTIAQGNVYMLQQVLMTINGQLQVTQKLTSALLNF